MEVVPPGTDQRREQATRMGGLPQGIYHQYSNQKQRGEQPTSMKGVPRVMSI